MDYSTKYSAVHIVSSTNLKEAVTVIEACWFSQFRHPKAIQGATAFDIGSFRELLNNLNIKFRPVPPRRHSKKLIESKHAVTRSVFVLLKDDAGSEVNGSKIVYQGENIANNVYGNELMSAFELAKGYTKPLI